MDSATFYLIIQMAAASSAPFDTVPPMIGPATQAQCEQTKASLSNLPEVVTASCKRVVGAKLCMNDGKYIATACPVFEGEIIFTGKLP